MNSILQKLPFLLELFFNGTYILIYFLLDSNRLPKSWNKEFVEMGLQFSSWLIPMVLFFVIIVNYNNAKTIDLFVRKHIFSLIIFIPMIITLGDMQFTCRFAAVHLVASILTLYEKNDVDKKLSKEKSQNKFFEKILEFLGVSFDKIIGISKFKTSQMVITFFITTILTGTFFLMFPFATNEGKSIGFVDALFMATSATCVTGLGTLSLSDTFSLFGQFVILILMQIGGLGYMIVYTFFIVKGDSFDFSKRKLMQDMLDVSSQEELIDMIRNIIKYTMAIELIGGIVLSIGFIMEGFEPGKAVYYGFFHAISAFCNAGFSLFNDSFESFSTKPLISMTICALIILGGVGFIVLREMKKIIIEKKSFARIGIHTKVVLLYSSLLIFGGTLFIFFGEFLHALDGYSLWEKFQISFFQSVTLRTAGFNTISLTSLSPYTLYLFTLLMFIGGGPGSTAGGVKVSTFAILIQSIRSTLKGQDKVEFFDRQVPQSAVVRATALTMISLMITSLFTFILMKFEKEQNFLTIFFEVMSASGTVGLSLGLTPFLSVAGKFAVVALMFIGRTGPLTLVLAIGENRKSSGNYSYPEGRIMIG